MKERRAGSRWRRQRCRLERGLRGSSAGCGRGGRWGCSRDSGRSWMLTMESGGRKGRMRMSTGNWMTTNAAPSPDICFFVVGGSCSWKELQED